jgi:uncharacterized protein (TIGR00369 family)
MSSPPDMDPSLDLLDRELKALQGSASNDLPMPPPCFVTMKGTFLRYEPRTLLTASFPVTKEMLNPVGTMQGGFLAAAFDNVLGPLSYLAARTPCVTIDLNTQFLRGIEAGETLTITARVVSRSPQTIFMTGEAFNGKGKLVGTASSNALTTRRS